MSDFPRFTPPPVLPDFEPPADLWNRIASQHRRRQRRRSAVAASVFAVAASLLVVVSTVGWQPAATAPEDAVVSLRREAMQLEQQLLGRRDVAFDFARLRPVDDALQRAYDRRASDDELLSLWAERTRLLQVLVDGDGSIAAPISI